MPLLRQVPQGHCLVVERFGRYNRTLRQGLHVLVPFIDRVRNVRAYGWNSTFKHNGELIELTEQMSDTGKRKAHTKDNVELTVDAAIYWQITDPAKALYEVDVLPKAICDTSLNALRANIGGHLLDEVLAERQKLNDLIATQLGDTAARWGVRINRIEIQELATTQEASKAMLQQMEAERRKRAQLADAEGQADAERKIAHAHRDAKILIAQGEAKALDLIATAESNYLKLLADAIGRDNAARVLIAQKTLEGFERISRNEADKVFLPNNFQAILGMSGNGTASAEHEVLSRLKPVG